MAAKMMQEQKEMQEFSSLMKSMLHYNKQHTTDLQDKITQVHIIIISAGMLLRHNNGLDSHQSTAAHEIVLTTGA